MGGRQKEGLITRDSVHYLGPPTGHVKRELDRGGPENGRYQGNETPVIRTHVLGLADDTAARALTA